MFQFKTVDSGFVALPVLNVLQMLKETRWEGGLPQMDTTFMAEWLMEVRGLDEQTAWEVIGWVCDEAWNHSFRDN